MKCLRTDHDHDLIPVQLDWEGGGEIVLDCPEGEARYIEVPKGTKTSTTRQLSQSASKELEGD